MKLNALIFSLIKKRHNYAFNNTYYDAHNYPNNNNNNYYYNSETHTTSIRLSRTSWTIPVSGQLYFILRLFIRRRLHCSSKFCFAIFELLRLFTFLLSHLQSCPAGQVFDPSTQYCDYPTDMSECSFDPTRFLKVKLFSVQNRVFTIERHVSENKNEPCFFLDRIYGLSEGLVVHH